MHAGAAAASRTAGNAATWEAPLADLSLRIIGDIFTLEDDALP
jgi:hypothetical protein